MYLDRLVLVVKLVLVVRLMLIVRRLMVVKLPFQFQWMLMPEWGDYQSDRHKPASTLAGTNPAPILQFVRTLFLIPLQRFAVNYSISGVEPQNPTSSIDCVLRRYLGPGHEWGNGYICPSKAVKCIWEPCIPQ